MRHAAPLLAALATAGCHIPDRQSALDPAGPQAARIHGLWDLYLGVTVAVYVLVMAVVVAAVLRRRRRHESDRPVTSPPVNEELRKGVVVAAATAVTVVILFVLLLGDFLTGRRVDDLARQYRDEAAAGTAVPTVRVTGHQWWWEVRHNADPPGDVVTTANALHLPVGRVVQLELVSADVIHSLWVPNLHGKTDLIPGHPTTTYLRADREGQFWGQCAEFCGLQHANMRLVVVAEPEEDFQRWLAARRQPAPEPKTEGEKRGRQVFLAGTCATCHAVSGTTAQSRVGPELSDVGSRPRIGAGTLERNRGNLAGWVADPHAVKPGVRMPPNPLPPEDLRAVVSYLESLK